MSDWKIPEHLAELAEMGGDELLQEIFTIFLEDTPKRVARIGDAMAQADADGVSKEAHGLKSGCLQIGADALAALSEELEHGAPADRWPSLLERISTEYQTLSEQIRRRFGT